MSTASGDPCSFLNVLNLETLLIEHFVATHYFNAQAILSFRHFVPFALTKRPASVNLYAQVQNGNGL